MLESSKRDMNAQYEWHLHVMGPVIPKAMYVPGLLMTASARAGAMGWGSRQCHISRQPRWSCVDLATDADIGTAGELGSGSKWGIREAAGD